MIHSIHSENIWILLKFSLMIPCTMEYITIDLSAGLTISQVESHVNPGILLFTDFFSARIFPLT